MESQDFIGGLNDQMRIAQFYSEHPIFMKKIVLRCEALLLLDIVIESNPVYDKIQANANQVALILGKSMNTGTITFKNEDIPNFIESVKRLIRPFIENSMRSFLQDSRMSNSQIYFPPVLTHWSQENPPKTAFSLKEALENI